MSRKKFARRPKKARTRNTSVGLADDAASAVVCPASTGCQPLAFGRRTLCTKRNSSEFPNERVNVVIRGEPPNHCLAAVLPRKNGESRPDIKTVERRNAAQHTLPRGALGSAEGRGPLLRRLNLTFHRSFKVTGG